MMMIWRMIDEAYDPNEGLSEREQRKKYDPMMRPLDDDLPF